MAIYVVDKFSQDKRADILLWIDEIKSQYEVAVKIIGLENIELPEEFWEIDHIEHLEFENSSSINVENLLKFPILRRLIFRECQTMILPMDFSTLIHLELFCLYKCEYIDVPDSLFQLTGLKDLQISFSHYYYLPESIGNLTNLYTLLLDSNYLQKLPNSFSKLSSLRYLDISNNWFVKFPSPICNLHKLRELYINVTPFYEYTIASIPPCIGNLSALTAIGLQNHFLNSLPQEFSALKKLNLIQLKGNPLFDMEEIREMGTYEIIEYLDRLQGLGSRVTFWEVPDSLSTAFQQYLNAFADFVFGLKGQKIKFEAIKVKNGLQLTTEPTPEISLEEINTLLENYFNRSTKFEEIHELTQKQKAQLDALRITWENDRSNFINRIQLLTHTNQLLAASVGNMHAIINLPQDVSFNTPLFDDPKPHTMHVGFPGANAVNVNVSLQVGETSPAGILEKFDPERLLLDLIDKAIRMMERKYTVKLEDLHNDEVVNFLRDRDFAAYDQTRSGSSKKTMGELDMMIRKDNGTPVCIIEAYRSASCGPEDKNISSHISKLLHDYDTAGHEVNFILVYCEGKNFEQYWMNYQEYVSDLNSKPEFKGEHKLISFNDTQISDKTDVKVGLAKHIRNGSQVRVYHIVTNMGV